MIGIDYKLFSHRMGKQDTGGGRWVSEEHTEGQKGHLFYRHLNSDADHCMESYIYKANDRLSVESLSLMRVFEKQIEKKMNLITTLRSRL